MPRPGRILRTAVAIAAFTGLSGCESVSDFMLGTDEAPNPHAEAPVAPPRPIARKAEVRDEVVRLDRAAVRRVQARLAKLGLRPGPIDGIAGPLTRGAVRRYQAAYHLPVDGRITARFLKHLEAPPAKKKTDPGPVTLGAEDLPAYQPGTTFVYSNGASERVADMKGLIVRWVRDDGTTYAAHRNFMLPRSYWTSDGERGSARISAEPDTLWPRREGAETEFSATVRLQQGDAPNLTEKRIEHWNCRNDRRQSISVAAGDFETVVLVCQRGEDIAAPQLVRTWYYAKTVRHYVRFVEDDRQAGTSVRVDLVAVRPSAPGWPPIVRAALDRAAIAALEAPESDVPILWSSSGVSGNVTIEAKPRFAAAAGQICRRFVQTWSLAGRQWLYPALACRTGPGQWTIPGVESGSGTVLATAQGTPGAPGAR